MSISKSIYCGNSNQFAEDNFLQQTHQSYYPRHNNFAYKTAPILTSGLDIFILKLSWQCGQCSTLERDLGVLSCFYTVQLIFAVTPLRTRGLAAAGCSYSAGSKIDR